MLENKQPFPEDDELSDTDLDQVSGGDKKPAPKPKPPTTNTNSGVGGDGLLTLDGIKGESKDDNHSREIDIE